MEGRTELYGTHEADPKFTSNTEKNCKNLKKVQRRGRRSKLLTWGEMKGSVLTIFKRSMGVRK